MSEGNKLKLSSHKLEFAIGKVRIWYLICGNWVMNKGTDTCFGNRNDMENIVGKLEVSGFR